MSRFRMLPLALLWVGTIAFGAGDGPAEWTSLDDGLELGRFTVAGEGVGGDGAITVLRADPRHWELDLFCATAADDRARRTAREWADEYGLVAAINGGMFDVDYLTHVGHCCVRDHVNNDAENEYQSVAACLPREGIEPAFRLFDLDDPEVNFKTITERYDCVVQNLRLIKRPGENRWSQQPKRWSEAALGEDAQGRILFIFTRTAFTMHDLNEILMELPLDLVAAQHLEGGPEAQLYVRSGDVEIEQVGSYETGFWEDDSNFRISRLPVVFGLRGKE